MVIKNIVSLVNDALAGEQLTYNELKRYLDAAIDEINAQLNSKYPVFSDLTGYDVNYNYFPDKYIRSVVVPGAAWKYYVTDEEGSQSAMQYSQDFARGLFIMLRDHLALVPTEYQADTNQGSVSFEFTVQQGIEIPYGIGEW